MLEIRSQKRSWFVVCHLLSHLVPFHSEQITVQYIHHINWFHVKLRSKLLWFYWHQRRQGTFNKKREENNKTWKKSHRVRWRTKEESVPHVILIYDILYEKKEYVKRPHKINERNQCVCCLFYAIRPCCFIIKMYHFMVFRTLFVVRCSCTSKRGALINLPDTFMSSQTHKNYHIYCCFVNGTKSFFCHLSCAFESISLNDIYEMI